MAATMTMDGLLDRYETNKLKNKNVEKILEQIVSHKEVVSYIIEGGDKYLTLALEEAQNILKDSKDKLEVLIGLDRLLKIYFESSVNKISTENCQKVREIYVDLKDSEYKIPKKQLETIRSMIGYSRVSKTNEKPIDIETKIEKTLSDLKVGEVVNRHILSNTVDAEVTEIDTKLIKCKYILGNQEFETCFSKDTGYRVNSNGKEIEQSYITIKND